MTGKAIMQNFTSDLGLTIGFLIGALLVNMTMGTKVLYYYLLLVLLSMVILNADTIGDLLKEGGLIK